VNIASVADPVYADAGNQSVRCTLTLVGGSPRPYLAANGDATSQALFNALVAGTYGAVAAYVAPAMSTASLRQYANAKTQTLLATPRTYALSGGPSVLADASTATGVDLNGLMVWGQANPSATTAWVDDNGGVTNLTGAQCVALALAVLAYGQSVYAVLASAMTGIANATLSSTAAIDALSWPA
jgi:hypothetical protein